MTGFGPSGPLVGTRRPPPDKSISHRAALVGAMAEGETEIRAYLNAEDTISTLYALRRLGATVHELGPPDESSGLRVRIEGIGLFGPGREWPGRGEPDSTGAVPIDVGNAGTLLRLLPGWLAGQNGGSWTLDGDESIRRRPVDRVVEPLRIMGAVVNCREGRVPPIQVEGGDLRGISYELPVASAQVKSCLLLAGLLAEGSTAILERRPTRDHTERMLRSAGARVRTETAGTPVAIRGELPARRVIVEPVDRVEPGEIAVPGDFSSAAILVVAAAIVAGSAVRLERVGLNPTRVGLLGILNRMGAAVEVEEDPADGFEPHGAIVARHGPLVATRVSADEVPLAIDELPLVALLGCFAEGRTVVSGAQELRHKESDRIATVVDGLRGLGAQIEATEDGFSVRGTGGLRGGRLDPRGDHRMAMLGAVAGLASREGVDVVGMDAAAVSYPGFAADLEALATRA